MDKVLIVDDSIVSCGVIQNVLTTRQFEVFTAYSGADALLAAVTRRPDLILLDVILHGENGYDVCKMLKDNPETREIPIVFLTSMSDEASIVEGFACGGVDYLLKPFMPVELLARVEAHIKTKQMSDLLKKANCELETMNRYLAEMVKEKELWGKTDQLTKLYNRHYITEMMPVWNSQLRNGRMFSMIMADIDNFKSINDLYGHCAGDFLLQNISAIIKSSCGNEQAATRWGGEEFLIVAPDMDLNHAVAIADDIRRRVAAYMFKNCGISFACTVTLGVSQGDASLGLEKTIFNADAALYEGKRGGRNRVVPSPLLYVTTD